VYRHFHNFDVVLCPTRTTTRQRDTEGGNGVGKEGMGQRGTGTAGRARTEHWCQPPNLKTTVHPHSTKKASTQHTCNTATNKQQLLEQIKESSWLRWNAPDRQYQRTTTTTKDDI